MMYKTLLLATSAAMATAQVTYDPATGAYTCAGNPNGAFCPPDGRNMNLIIRCNNGVGRLSNCDLELANYPPLDMTYAPCYETSATDGDAACSKDCVVYGSSGTFLQPNCYQVEPISTPSTTPATSTSPATSSETSATTSATSTVSTSPTSASASTSISSGTTDTTSCTHSLTSTGLSTTAIGSKTASTSAPTDHRNSTFATGTKPATSTVSTVPFTGSAATTSVAVSLAGLGLAITYFL